MIPRRVGMSLSYLIAWKDNSNSELKELDVECSRCGKKFNLQWQLHLQY